VKTMHPRSAAGLIRDWNAVTRFADRPSEWVLALFLADRDEAAFRELLRRHGPHVWAVCRRLLPGPGDADDAFQETFLALVRNGRQVRTPGALAGWLDRTARRAAGAIRRKQARRAEVEEAAPVREGGTMDGPDPDRAEAVRAAVAELPEKYRLPVTYRYLAGLTPQEVAAALGLPERTGRTRLQRGVAMLRERLAGKGLAVGAGIGTGTVTLESALTAAAEAVPEYVLTALLDAVKALPVKRSLLAAVLGVVTFRRGMIVGWTLAAGMATALVLMPDSKPQPVRISSNSPTDKGSTMRGTSIFATAVALLLAPKAPAQTFTKIVDSGTPIPGGTGNFTNLGAGPFSGSNIGFVGQGANNQSGVYTIPVAGGPISIIADTQTPIPGGPGNFTNFSGNGTNKGFAISGPLVAFSGLAYSSDPFPGSPLASGVYVGTAGNAPTVIADQNTQVPGGTGNFYSFTGGTSVAFSGNSLVFTADRASGGRYLYTRPISGGPIVPLVDQSTPIPGGNFTGLDFSAVSGNVAAFISSMKGIYTVPTTGGAVTRLVDTNTLVPNGSGTFVRFTYMGFSNSFVTFEGGASASDRGIYAVPVGGGAVAKLADRNTPIPGGSGTFNSFGRSEAYGPDAVFLAAGANGKNGLYKTPLEGGTVTKIIGPGDVLDGKTVDNLNLGWNADDGGSRYSFAALFTDGSAAVYVFTPVHEPTGLLPFSVAAAAGAFALGRWLSGGL
jgi:RNA polymerase sigma factor (sigma-70 family)